MSRIARTLIAGPEYRNAVAGPMPAPRVYSPAKRGNTVQEQTAKTVPDTDATPYDKALLALGPKYRITAD